MSQSLRILTAILVTLVAGSFCIYDTIQENGPDYQSHPAAAVLGAFWVSPLAGLTFYFVVGLLFKRKATKSDSSDKKLYEQVARELQHGPPLPGLWLEAYSEAGGDEAKARALYIRYRVQQLREETVAEHKGQRREAERAAEAANPSPKWHDKIVSRW